MAEALKKTEVNSEIVDTAITHEAQGAGILSTSPIEVARARDFDWASGRGTKVWWVATGLLAFMAVVFGIATYLGSDN